MKEIRVSQSESWQQQHWRSLESAYNRSPFFDHYASELEELFRSRKQFLFDWNLACLEWVKAKTGWPPVIGFSAPVTAPEPKSEKNGAGPEYEIDWRNRMLPKNYLTFPSPVYRQVFEDKRGFQVNLSVLDLLFNTGPESGSYLGQPVFSD